MQGTVRPPLNTQIEATNEKDLRSERLIHNLYQTIGPTSSITVIFISKVGKFGSGKNRVYG
jgi:hypothetical protein